MADRPIRKIARILAPVFLLLLCLATLNVVPRLLPSADGAESNGTLSPTPVPLGGPLTPSPSPTIVVRESPPPSAVPVPIPSPSATPIAASTVPPGAMIQLLGPPPDFIYIRDAPTGFFWKWPEELSADQRFYLYVATDDGERILGFLEGPNLGNIYHLSAMLDDEIALSDEAFWQVRLESGSSEVPLVVSEIRRFSTDSIP